MTDKLSPPQMRMLRMAYDNGGSVNDYGNPATGFALVRRGLMRSSGPQLGSDRCARDTFRRFTLTPSGAARAEALQGPQS